MSEETAKSDRKSPAGLPDRSVKTPFSVAWREFNIRFLPVLVFVICVLTVFWLWPPGLNGHFIGLAEGRRAVVQSPQVGLIESLKVQPYDAVEAGQLIAILRPDDPRVRLSLLQSRLDMERIQREPSLAQRNSMDFERIRLDIEKLKEDLDVERVNFEYHERNLQRSRELYGRKLIPETEYDLVLKDRDTSMAALDQKQKALESARIRMDQLRLFGDPTTTLEGNAAKPSIPLPAYTPFLATPEQEPIELRAPLDGIVSVVYRNQGENVAAGEPLIVIHSVQAERITGYLRQPFPRQVVAGQLVEIRSRNKDKHTHRSSVLRVGAQVETITNSLAVVRQGVLLDSGLPIVVGIPQSLKITPGETVDIIISEEPPGTLHL